MPRANAERPAGAETARCERQGDAEERAGWAGAERAGGAGQRRVDGLERRDRSAEVEGAGDEHDREHDRDLGEGDRDAEHVQRAAEQAEAAEGGEETDAGHRGRQHERQLDSGHEERLGAEPSATAIRYAAGVPTSRITAFAISVVFSVTTSASIAAGSFIPSSSSPGRDVEEDREDRQQQERERECGREREDATANGLLTGARSRRCGARACPSVLSRSATSSSAASRFFEPFTTATS